MKDTKLCCGCRNNFYNGNNDLGVKRCWSADKAEIVTRFTLSINTPMHIKEAYRKEQLPSCYKRQGYVHLDQIPDYAQTAEERSREEATKKEFETNLAKYVPPQPRPFTDLIDDDCPF